MLEANVGGDCLVSWLMLIYGNLSNLSIHPVVKNLFKVSNNGFSTDTFNQTYNFY